MTEATIRCPNCGTEIPVTDALQASIRSQLETELARRYEARQQQAVEAALHERELEMADLRAEAERRAKQLQAAEQAQLELRRRARELEEAQARVAEQVREQAEAELQKRLETEREKVRAAERGRLQAEAEQERKLLQEQLEEQRQKAVQAQQAELALRKEKQQLEDRARDLDLEVQRRIDAEKRRLEEKLRQQVAEEQGLKLKEKEKQIEDLRQALEDAKRRSELGSQELQGEVLELDIQAELERRFPHDRIEPVPKGIRGADIIHRVCDVRGVDCGAIIWETKNTKIWQSAWIEKLKDDMRAVGGAVPVLVSVALPDGVKGFTQIDGVWVCDLPSWPALAAVLREQLIQVAFARMSQEGKAEKMELLYQYLAGDEFRQRVETIVEAFDALQGQIMKERRAMERQWKEREKQLERVINSTAGMYGSLQGIVGASLASIPALELDAPGLLEEPDDQ